MRRRWVTRACVVLLSGCSADERSRSHGDGGGGVPGLLLGSPRDDAGNLIMLGTGRQHWSNVHVADLREWNGANDKRAKSDACNSPAADPIRCTTAQWCAE